MELEFYYKLKHFSNKNNMQIYVNTYSVIV